MRPLPRTNRPLGDWHLDHKARREGSRDGYIAVSHAPCNLAAGADKVNGQRRAVREALHMFLSLVDAMEPLPSAIPPRPADSESDG